MTDRAPVWDGFTRLFHWTLVLLVAAQFYTAFEGPIEWHMAIGEAILALVAARLAWGFIGSTSARFGAFVKGPAAVIGYLKGLRSAKDDNAAGHNPAGGWMVVFLLLALAVQLGLGLFASDPDDFVFAPLSGKVSEATSHAITEAHEAIGFFILGLIGVHIAAVLFYAVGKRFDLVRPMIDGKKALGAEGREEAARIRFRPLWLGLLLTGLAGAAVYAAL